MRRSITYGEERISFSVRLVSREARRLSIHVLPNGSVQVEAPADADAAEITAAVRKRARWIWLRLRAYGERTRHLLPREYVSGETHFYLGRRYVLKVIYHPTAEQGVKLLGGRLEVRARSRDAAKVRTLLIGWYRERADAVFARRLADCAARVKWLKAKPGFRLLTMKTQWGSCSPKGEILLNPLLVKAPSQCIDYVIFHELCHLKEHNHSPRFYSLLEALMPDWQGQKAGLDELADQLLNQ